MQRDRRAASLHHFLLDKERKAVFQNVSVSLRVTGKGGPCLPARFIMAQKLKSMFQGLSIKQAADQQADAILRRNGAGSIFC